MTICMVLVETLKGRSSMGKYNRYDDEFKQNLVNLYQSGKTQTDIAKEYGVSPSVNTLFLSTKITPLTAIFVPLLKYYLRYIVQLLNQVRNFSITGFLYNLAIEFINYGYSFF